MKTLLFLLLCSTGLALSPDRMLYALAAPVINVRFGTAGSTADTARLTFTFLAQTTLQVTSASFDATSSSLIVGASVNAGASAVWTVQNVQAELSNLT